MLFCPANEEKYKIDVSLISISFGSSSPTIISASDSIGHVLVPSILHSISYNDVSLFKIILHKAFLFGTFILTKNSLSGMGLLLVPLKLNLYKLLLSSHFPFLIFPATKVFISLSLNPLNIIVFPSKDS